MTIVSTTLKNNSNQTFYVSGDPNWDDQQLIINGEVAYSSVLIGQNESVLVEVDWGSNAPDELMVGLYLSGDKYANKDVLGITIGENPKTQLLDVTECNELGLPHITYQVSEATMWSLTLSLSSKIG